MFRKIKTYCTIKLTFPKERNELKETINVVERDLVS